MATWNNTFDQIPRNGNNPGAGAQAIRDLKTAIVERGDLEHVWGQNETETGTTGGTHREGAARAGVIDDAAYSQDRLDNQIPSLTSGIGRIIVDMSIVAPAREQDGTSLITIDGDYENQYTKKISVVIPDLSSGGTWNPAVTQLAEVFASDSFMDIVSDQTANGIKTFTLSPVVPDVGVQSTLVGSPGDDHRYDPADSEKGTNAGEIYFAVDDGKYHNLFDPDDADNAPFVLTGDNGDYVNKNIKCNEMQAESIIGVVWI